jgi:hypothetical protein
MTDYMQVVSNILDSRQPFGKLPAGYGEFGGQIFLQDNLTSPIENNQGPDGEDNLSLFTKNNTKDRMAVQPPSKEADNSEGWKIMGPKGKEIKEPVTAMPTTLKWLNWKRAPPSSILDSSIWNSLALPLTPKEGEKRLQLWPVIHMKKARGRVYHNLLLGELLCIQIRLAPHQNLIAANIRQQYWEQLQANLFMQIGQGNKVLTSEPWEEVEWVEK